MLTRAKAKALRQKEELAIEACNMEQVTKADPSSLSGLSVKPSLLPKNSLSLISAGSSFSSSTTSSTTSSYFTANTSFASTSSVYVTPNTSFVAPDAQQGRGEWRLENGQIRRVLVEDSAEMAAARDAKREKMIDDIRERELEILIKRQALKADIQHFDMDVDSDTETPEAEDHLMGEEPVQSPHVRDTPPMADPSSAVGKKLRPLTRTDTERVFPLAGSPTSTPTPAKQVHSLTRTNTERVFPSAGPPASTSTPMDGAQRNRVQPLRREDAEFY